MLFLTLINTYNITPMWIFIMLFKKSILKITFQKKPKKTLVSNSSKLHNYTNKHCTEKCFVSNNDILAVVITSIICNYQIWKQLVCTGINAITWYHVTTLIFKHNKIYVFLTSNSWKWIHFAKLFFPNIKTQNLCNNYSIIKDISTFIKINIS